MNGQNRPLIKPKRRLVSETHLISADDNVDEDNNDDPEDTDTLEKERIYSKRGGRYIVDS